MRRLLLVLVVLSLLVPEILFAKEQKPANDAFNVIMSTKYDFGETGIDGSMKAPDGFFLQGRQSQSLSQMVRLRNSFKKELRNSRSGVKNLAK